MSKWIFIGILSAIVALAVQPFRPQQDAIFLAANVVASLSLARFIYMLIFRIISSIPVVPEQHVAVITRHGRYVGIQGGGRMYRWLLKPLLYPFDEIRIVIPQMPLLFETATETFLTHELRKVQAALQMSYFLGSTADDIRKAAFRVPDPPGWKDAIAIVASEVLRATVVNETLFNLIENPMQINKSLRQAIGERIGLWGFEVQWVRLINLDVVDGKDQHTEQSRSTRVQAKATVELFLSYARLDAEKVEELYQDLSDAGFKPWMDKKDIWPGEKWELAIKKAIRGSAFFLACLSSNSVDKRGMIQKEIKEALNVWEEKLDSDIYVIPVRLEDCKIPESLLDFEWVNLFEEDGWERLVKAIQIGMERRQK
jgi:regulator of protease activity HflC (stomatin/prohibitin superfamily)